MQVALLCSDCSRLTGVSKARPLRSNSLIRHPVYAAWLVYASGTLMSFRPSATWRCSADDSVHGLANHSRGGIARPDPQYRAYRQRVRWRLGPLFSEARSR